MTYSDVTVAQKIGDILDIMRGHPQVGQSPTDQPGVPRSYSAGYQGAGASGSDQTDFFRAVLSSLGMPVTDQNLAFMDAWARGEGMDSSHYNPFATTQGAVGANSINDVGVKSYPDFNTGVQATVQTLQNGLYGNILAGLASSNAIMAAQGLADSPWGTGSLPLRILQGG